MESDVDALEAIRADDVDYWHQRLNAGGPKPSLPYGTTVLGAALANRSALILDLLLGTYPECVHVADSDGWYGLHVCAALGLTAEATLLLERQANPHACTKAGDTALDLSVRRNHQSVAALLSQDDAPSTRVMVTPTAELGPLSPISPRPQYARPVAKKAFGPSVPSPFGPRNPQVTFDSPLTLGGGRGVPHAPVRGIQVKAPPVAVPKVVPHAPVRGFPAKSAAPLSCISLRSNASPTASFPTNVPVPPPTTPCGELPTPLGPPSPKAHPLELAPVPPSTPSKPLLLSGGSSPSAMGHPIPMLTIPGMVVGDDTLNLPPMRVSPKSPSLPPLSPVRLSPRARKGSRSTSPQAPFPTFKQAPRTSGNSERNATEKEKENERTASKSISLTSNPRTPRCPIGSPSIESEGSRPAGTRPPKSQKSEKASMIQRAFRRRAIRSWVRITVQGCGGSLKWNFGERGATVSNFTVSKALIADATSGVCVKKGDMLCKINNVFVLDMPRSALKTTWKEERGAGTRTVLRIVRPLEREGSRRGSVPGSLGREK